MLVEEVALASSITQEVSSEAVAPFTNSFGKAGSGFDASTRASSPGATSSSSSDGTTHGSPAVVGTLAQRRGLRAAILDDLGVDLSANTAEPAQAPANLAAGTRFTSSPFNSSPRPIGDASQRSPVQTFGGHPSPIGNSAQWSPATRVSIVSGSLGSVPIRVPRGGDASDRSPPGHWAPRCGHSPVAHQAGVPVWGSAMASVEATRAAATAQAQTMSCGNHWPHSTSGAQQPSWGTSTQTSPQASTSLDQGEAMRRWLLGMHEGPCLSNKELADRMRAAEPETYDD